jgi:serine protease Do
VSPLKAFFRLVVAASMLVCVLAYAEEIVRTESASVLKVRAVTRAGERVEGSAVIVGPGELVTNCHVVRDAHRISLARGSESWTAQVRGGDPDQDLCLLTAAEFGAPAAIPATAGELSVGDTVYAVGYPAGAAQPRVRKGRVESLYQFQDSWVIQTSAEFGPGASGGALFDAAGRLVGVLTFRGPGGGKFHFAVPVDWIAPVRAATALHGTPKRVSAFWERNPDELPRFLRATWFEAKKRWPELFEECERWAAQNPDSDEPRRSMARAAEHLLNVTRAAAPGSRSTTEYSGE